MSEIRINSIQETQSKVYTGSKASGAAGYLKDFQAIYIVYDNAVRRYAEAIASELEPGTCKGLFGITPTERTKGMETVLDICRWLMENGADRKAMLLSVGGGITTDIGGFAAAIYKRGINSAFVPTTLLAQTDASIGGKNGVNFMGLKNMIGVIRQPVFTYSCPEVLETLPYRDFVSGSAEILKTFIIDNTGGNYQKAVKVFSAIAESGNRAGAIAEYQEELLQLINAAAGIKAGIVGRDQFETGERRKLNLGHTFAHAIEALEYESHRMRGHNGGATADKQAAPEERCGITHGEAVAIGLVLAARMSESTGIAKTTGLSAAIAKDLISCGLPTISPFHLAEMENAMQKDKKAEGKAIRFILIEEIGKVVEKEFLPGQAIETLTHGADKENL